MPDRVSIFRSTLSHNSTAFEIAEPLNNGCFRVQVGKNEIDVSWISPLQLVDPNEVRSDAKQTIVLRRAIDRNRLFYTWRRREAAKLRDRRRVRILHLDRPGDDGFPVNVFTLLAATPVRWTGPGFDAMQPDIAHEEIELSYRSLLWIQLRRPDAAGKSEP